MFTRHLSLSSPSAYPIIMQEVKLKYLKVISVNYWSFSIQSLAVTNLPVVVASVVVLAVVKEEHL